MIRLRLETRGSAPREYAFHRTRIGIGRSPMNDLTIPLEGISARHGTLQLEESGALMFTPVTDATLVRRNQKRVITERHEVLAGDALFLSEGVRIVLLGTPTEASTTQKALRLPLAVEDALDPPSFLTDTLLPLALALHRAPDAGRFLADVRPILSQLFEREPEDVFLLQMDNPLLPERLLHLEEGALNPAHAPALPTGANKRTAVFDLLREGGLIHYAIDTSSHCVAITPPTGPTQGRHALICILGPIDALSRSPASRRMCLESWASAAGCIAPLLLGLSRHEKTRNDLTHLRSENSYFRDRQRRHYLFKELVTESPAMREIYAQLSGHVGDRSPVVLVGEAGTGKELIARALHHLGNRSAGLLVAQSCDELDEDMLDIELFGGPDQRGATRLGIFELAEGGTVYLDGIGKLGHRLQYKILRVLNEGEIRRPREEQARAVDVRIVASTHDDLNDLVATGALRKDFAVALLDNVITIPALRDRQDDILPLTHIFLDVFSKRYGLPRPILGECVEPALKAHRWPGNVRELQNSVEAAVLRNVQRPLEAEDFGI